MKKPTIIFADEGTVNLGDLDMRPLKRLGRYRGFPLSSPSQLVQRAKQAEIVIANKSLLQKRELARLPRLKLICVSATGVNNVDLETARRRGIAVTNVPGYSTTTVAEQTMMFLLALSHRLIEHHEAASRRWSQSSSYSIPDYPFLDLEGKTLGIIGYGAIGRRVARLARAFGMKVLHTRPLPLNQLLAKSDFVTLHCPLTEKTRHLINKKTLHRMKRTAYLLNLARGPIVDESAVARALRRGTIAGYAADVLSAEPPPRNHPLLKPSLKSKVLLSPHIAWASRESRQRLVNEIALNIIVFLNGRLRNRII